MALDTILNDLMVNIVKFLLRLGQNVLVDFEVSL